MNKLDEWKKTASPEACDKIGKYYAVYEDTEKTKISCVRHIVGVSRHFDPMGYVYHEVRINLEYDLFSFTNVATCDFGEEISEGKAKDFAVKCVKNHIKCIKENDAQYLSMFFRLRMGQ